MMFVGIRCKLDLDGFYLEKLGENDAIFLFLLFFSIRFEILDL